MTLKQLERNAEAFFDSGYNCAESVSQAVIEAFSAEHADGLPRLASAFGGGIGGSKQELCGAFTGGVMAIGFLLGRSEPGIDISIAKAAAQAFRQVCLQKYGSLNCGRLLEAFGDQVNYDRCRRMVSTVTTELAHILAEHGLTLKP